MPDENNEAEERILWATSIYGQKTRKGLVRLDDNDGSFDIQISPTEARAFAHSILESAEAAETDEFIISWLINRVGMKTDAQFAPLLTGFRKLREMMRNGEDIKPG